MITVYKITSSKPPHPHNMQAVGKAYKTLQERATEALRREVAEKRK